MNTMTVVGSITAPEFFDGETPRLTFAVADRAWNSKTKEDEIQWVRCVAFGKRAIGLNKFLARGHFTTVIGTVRMTRYKDREGIERHNFNVIVEGVEARARNKPQPTPVENDAGVEPYSPDEHGAPDDDDIPF